MEIFWNTIAQYNAGTWVCQIVLIVAAVVLTVALFRCPNRWTRSGMKIFLALLNAWIAGVYYCVYCEQRSYNVLFAVFWGVMALFWIYDLLTGYTPFERSYRHDKLAVVLCLMPLVYPVFSLIRGLRFPMITSPLMPCSVVVFTIGLLLAFSKRVNIFLVLFLIHWTLIGFSKIYFFSIPEDLLLASAAVPALYLFFKEYIDSNLHRSTKPTARTMNVLLLVVCSVIGVLFSITLVHELVR